MRNRIGQSLLLLAVCASAAHAQLRPRYGAAIEYRAQLNASSDSTKRHGGLAIRLMMDGAWTPVFGWRFEGAYTQAQYSRKYIDGTAPINEYGYEIGGSVRAQGRLAKLWRPYVVGGPVLSLRGSCSFDNAFDRGNVISCGDGNTIRFGWGAGAGVRYTGGIAGSDYMFETRVLGNLTSNGGGRSIAVAFGAGM
jgi:hypothetical protein